MSNVLSLRTPKYRKHKATGQAVVTIAGRDFYLGKHNSAASREEYRRLVAEYMQTATAPGPDRQREITVVEVIVAYTKFARTYYVKNGKTTREYEKVVEVGRYTKQLYGRTKCIEFGPLALKAVRQSMVDAGLSRGVVNKHVQLIRRMFRWAAAEEMIPASIPQALSMVAGLRAGRTEAPETAPILPVEDKVVDATLDHLPDVVADMVRLQRYTGMRPAEVTILRPCDVDRTGEVWLYRPESHKTQHHGRERVVLLGPKAQGVLLRYLARDSEAYCFQPRDSEAKRLAARHASRKTPLCCGNKPGSNRARRPLRSAGNCYTTVSYRRAIYRGCDKAFPAPKGTEGPALKQWQKRHRWAPNQLRHAAATEARREFGLEAAQVLLGHSCANVTQVYAERDMLKGIEAAKQIG